VAPFDLRQLTVPLRPLSDTSAADWFVDSEADWWTKVCLGPPGYETYARVFYDINEDAPAHADAIVRQNLRRVLARHSPAGEFFFGVWNGNPGSERWLAGARISVHTEPGRTGHDAAARTYHLFTGPLSQAHEADDGHGVALTWPADHAWFVAGDVDPDWIGVGGSQALIDELAADATLDVELTTYDATRWEDR